MYCVWSALAAAKGFPADNLSELYETQRFIAWVFSLGLEEFKSTPTRRTFNLCRLVEEDLSALMMCQELHKAGSFLGRQPQEFYAEIPFANPTYSGEIYDQ